MYSKVKEEYLYPRPQLCLCRGVILENLSSNDFDNIRNFTISKRINEVDCMTLEIPFSECRKIDYNNSELLIKFENDYYIIKNVSITSTTNGIIKVTALREQEELKTCYCEPIDLIGATPKEMFDEIKKTTLHSSNLNYYWKGTDVENGKRRQLQCAEEQSVYENLIAMAKVFNGWLEFSTDENGVNWIFLRTQSIVSGKYVKKNLDMKELNITYNSDEIFTRLIVYGNVVDLSGHELNIMEVNPTGKEYVENYDYYLSIGIPKEIIEKEPKYQKIKILRDDKYVEAKDLYEFALEEIKKCSQPKLEANISISDDSIFEDSLEIPPQIGYEINCIDSEIGFILSCRIDGVERNYDNPSEVKIEISNFLAYDTVFQNIQHSADEADKNGSKIPIINEELITNIEHLKATNIEVKNLWADKAEIKDLEATNANVKNLYATKAEITDLKATNANIDNLKVNVGEIQTLVNGNLTSDDIQSLILSSDKVTVENGFVKNAMIDNLDVSKINAGIISTDKFNITSKDGGISIVGATQQFKDKNNKVRIQMGQDTQGNFNFILRGEDGATTLIDHNGVKEKAIANDLIKSNMISENAVGEKQLNYSSFSQGFNKTTNSNFINASKVNVDLTGQTLELSFKNLDTTVKGIGDKTNSNLTEIKAIQGKITTLISNTTITKDGKTTQLKDEYNATVLEVDKIQNTISQHESKFSDQNQNISEVKDKTNTIERNLNETKSTLIETNKTLNNNTSKITEMNQTLNGFTTRVSSVEEKNTQISSNLNEKADKSVVNTMSGEIGVLKDNIKLKVDETTFTTSTKDTNGKIETLINKANTNLSEINLLKDNIKLKVEQDQIDGAISSLKSSINLDLEGIRSTVSKSMSTKNLINNSSFDNPLGHYTTINGSPFHCGITNKNTYTQWGYKAFELCDNALVYRVDTAGDNYVELWDVFANVKANTKYTISYYYTMNGQVTGGSSHAYCINNSIEGLLSAEYIGAHDVTNRNEWKRFSKTITTPDKTEKIVMRFGFGQNDGLTEMLVTALQIEEGETLTSWTNSVDSIVNSSMSTKITQLSNQISSSVTKDNIGSLITQNYDSVSVAISKKTNSSAIFDSDGLTVNNNAFRIINNGKETLKIDTKGKLVGQWGYIVQNYYEDEGCVLEGSLAEDSLSLQMYDSGRIYESTMLAGKKGFIYDNDIITSRSFRAMGSISATGSVSVEGEKNCIQNTKNYGKRKINAYETAEYYFGDIGSGIINENGECMVVFEDIFKECVNTNIEYQVFIQKYSKNSNINEIERQPSYFIVYGTPFTQFGWEIKAKRIGYENNRLDKVINIEDEIEEISSQNYFNDIKDNLDLENSLLKTK